MSVGSIFTEKRNDEATQSLRTIFSDFKGNLADTNVESLMYTLSSVDKSSLSTNLNTAIAS